MSERMLRMDDPEDLREMLSNPFAPVCARSMFKLMLEDPKYAARQLGIPKELLEDPELPFEMMWDRYAGSGAPHLAVVGWVRIMLTCPRLCAFASGYLHLMDEGNDAHLIAELRLRGIEARQERQNKIFLTVVHSVYYACVRRKTPTYQQLSVYEVRALNGDVNWDGSSLKNKDPDV
jgi:hypothetical protein